MDARARIVLFVGALTLLLPSGLALATLLTREDTTVAVTTVAPDVTFEIGESGATTLGASRTSATTTATLLRVGDIGTLSVLRGAPEWTARLTLVDASGHEPPDNVSLALAGATTVTQIAIENGAITRSSGPAVALDAGGLSVRAVGTCGGTCAFSTLLVLAPVGGASPALAYAYHLSVVSPRGPPPVSLGTASAFAILSKAGITTTGATTIVGDIGVSPIASGAMTGFGLVMDPTGRSSTSTLVSGRVFAADYAAPTPAQLAQAIADLESAVSDATARAGPSTAELGAGAIGGRTLPPGSYTWTTPLSAWADVVLDGGPEDTWILHTTGTFDVGTGAKILLTGGAQAKNVFWQVAGQVTLGTGSTVKGSILGGTAIAMMTGARLDGRAFAQTAVTLDANAISSG